MSLYNKLFNQIYFKRVIEVDAKQIGEEYFRDFNLNGADGNGRAQGSREAQAGPVITPEVENIVTAMNNQIVTKFTTYFSPDPEGIEDEEPSTKLEFVQPGETRGVDPHEKDFYRFSEINKPLDIKFDKDAGPELKEAIKAGYKLSEFKDENDEIRRKFEMSFNLKDPLSAGSKAMTEMIESLRVFHSELVKEGIESNFNPNTGELTITFSSERGIKDELSKIADIDSKESAALYEKIEEKFLENDIIQKEIEAYNTKIENDIFGEENNNGERIGGIFQAFTEDEARKQLVERIVQTMMANPRFRGKSADELRNTVKETIKSNFSEELQIKQNLFKLLALRKTVLSKESGFDGIIENVFKSSIAGNISKQFKTIIRILAKAGMDVSENDLFSSIDSSFDKKGKKSLDPMKSYAHYKIEEMDRDNKKDYDKKMKDWIDKHPTKTQADYEEEFGKFKTTLEKVKESFIKTLDSKIQAETEKLQKITNDRGDLENHLKEELGLNQEQNRNAGIGGR